ncbi:MFS transporter- SP family- sugar:H+ symporter [Apiospora hydei]|uniref:MFS transporter- SP family- sugar:H+ symporter n=1 Tax=Apiospora hydei TaxID=1337664 RepID=A0ABR1UT86_9PEZI
MLGMSTHVTFDHVNVDKNEPEKASSHVDGPSTAETLDYSPLRRLTGRSIAMGALVSMGGLIFGYVVANAQLPRAVRFPQPPNGKLGFSNTRSGLIVGLLSIGTLVGALIAAPVADKIGRRWSICLWTIIVSVGFVIQVAASTVWEQIMAGRLVAGFGVGALSLLVPMYQAETAPPWIRGALVCTYQLFITLGIFLAACFNYGTYTHQQNSSASWRIVIGLGWLWTIMLGLGILLFSETPRFDYRRGRIDEARRTLMRVYGAPANHYAVHLQMEEIGSKLRAESQIKQGAIRGDHHHVPGPAHGVPDRAGHDAPDVPAADGSELLLLLRHRKSPQHLK